MISCEDEIPLNCDQCYELSFDSSELVISPENLTPGINYHLYIIDKFNKRYGITTTIAEDGSFEIDTTLLPAGLLNAYAGKFELFLSTTNTGEDYDTPVTFDDVQYNCIIASFNIVASDIECCENPTAKTLCELIDEGSVQAIADCVEGAGKTEDLKDLICTLDPVTLTNSDETYTEEVTPGTTKVLDDTEVTQSDGTSESVPYGEPVVCQQIEDSLVKDGTGATIYELGSGDIVTIQPRTTFKSDGTTPYGVDQFHAANRTIPAVACTDVDGTLSNKDGGDSFAAASSIYPVDRIGGCFMAYSLDKLAYRAFYSSVLRRSSDNATTLVGFNGSDVDAASIATFIGAGTGSFPLLVNQGIGQSATQTTAANQPTYDPIDGEIKTTTTNTQLLFSNDYAPNADFTMAFWMKSNAVSSGLMLPLVLGTGSTNNLVLVLNDGRGMYLYWQSSGANIISVTSTVGQYTNTNWFHVMIIRSGTTMSLYIDNILVGSSTSNTLYTLGKTGNFFKENLKTDHWVGFNHALSVAQRSFLVSYKAKKAI